MKITEYLLYSAARALYRTQLAHSREMREAKRSPSDLGRYRYALLDGILLTGTQLGVTITGKTVLDLGCADGALTRGYLERGAARVCGVDIDHAAIQRATSAPCPPSLEFRVCGTTALPYDDGVFEVILCYDVFEHVARPIEVLNEAYRVLKPNGAMLIGTWGWYHPYAPHLFSTMPVPWAHVLFCERTLMRACRRVYQAPWYVPYFGDLDRNGKKKPDKYLEEHISTDYLNKLLIRDLERIFRKSSFENCVLLPKPFGSAIARWTKVFLHTPWIREFVTGYLWVVLTKTPPTSGEW